MVWQVDERVIELDKIRKYILDKSIADFGEELKITFKQRPHPRDFYDRHLISHCIARMSDGAMLKDFIASIDRQWGKLTPDADDPRGSKRLVSQFFNKKNFWEV